MLVKSWPKVVKITDFCFLIKFNWYPFGFIRFFVFLVNGLKVRFNDPEYVFDLFKTFFADKLVSKVIVAMLNA